MKSDRMSAGGFDDLQGLLSREPRGHRDMFAGIVTPASNEAGDFAIIFLDARRYPYMCGHGVMATVKAFIEMGCLAAPVGDVPVAVDMTAGLVLATAKVSRTSQVKIRVKSVVGRMCKIERCKTCSGKQDPFWERQLLDLTTMP